MNTSDTDHRYSFWHYYNRANDARASSTFIHQTIASISDGSHSVENSSQQLIFALQQTFRREAAYAIETLYKSILCKMVNLGHSKSFPFNHNVYQLWQQAKLGEINAERAYFLIEATEILYWRGRYPSPQPNPRWRETFSQPHKSMAGDFKKIGKIGKTDLFRARPFDYSAFDCLWRPGEARIHELDSSVDRDIR